MKPRLNLWMRRVQCWFLGAVSATTFGGCGVHYYDSKTGVEHLWGFGHMRMRVQPPAEGVQAVVKGSSIVGVKVGGGEDDYGVSLGYDSQRVILISQSNVAFGLEWPDASFFNVRIGTNPPFAAPPHGPAAAARKRCEPGFEK
jgi:hypothetical protein